MKTNRLHPLFVSDNSSAKLYSEHLQEVTYGGEVCGCDLLSGVGELCAC